MALAKIEIEPIGDSPTFGAYKIFANGEDISKYVGGIDISLHPDEAPHIYLTIFGAALAKFPNTMITAWLDEYEELAIEMPGETDEIND